MTNVEIKTTKDIKESPVFGYYQEQLSQVKDQFTGMGYSSGFADSLLFGAYNSIRAIWVEEDSKPSGIIIFGETFTPSSPGGRRIMNIHLFSCQPHLRQQLFDSFEELCKKENIKRIVFMTGLKDLDNIVLLEKLGLKQEYYHLFKKID